MKKNYMKGLLLIVTLSVFAFAGNSQTVHQDYQDGKIWFKVTNTTPILDVAVRKDAGFNMNYDPTDIDYKMLPYLKSMFKDYQIERLSRPFHTAKKGKGAKALRQTFMVKFSDIQRIDELIEKLNASSAIEYAEKVPLDRTSYIPNDPAYNASQAWGLFKINAAQAWNISFGDPNITVATVDNAVQVNHTDLTASVWVNPGEIAGNNIDDDGNGYVDDINGFDVSDNDNNPNPPNNSFDHGTHVAGTTGATTDNNTGVPSIGFGISIIGVKATPNNGNPGLIYDGYSGIIYAVNAGANVINCSWGGPGFSQTSQNIVTWAWNNGSIVVAAAGNSNTNTLHYPSAYTNVVAVAATNQNDIKASFSNYGTWVDVSAPGVSIYSTVPTNNYAYMQGTSMASPMVAGLCGLIWSANPAMTATDVVNCLTSTTVNIDGLNPLYVGQLGTGRIDAVAALNCATITLNNPPVADFDGSPTQLLEGASVNFWDLSVYTPTSWSWTFAGGTPGNFNGQNPPAIMYNTAGTYNVTLVVQNANGQDTELKSNFIIVDPNTGCDTLGDHAINPQGTPSIWTIGGNGYLCGTSTFDDQRDGAYFNGAPFQYCIGTWIWFNPAYDNNPNTIVPIEIYDGTGQTVGALLGSTNINMGDIMFDFQNNFLTRVKFDPPVTLPGSGEFFLMVNLNNLTWPADTLNVICNGQNEEIPGRGWEQWNDNTWHAWNTVYTVGGNPLEVSPYINPFVTDVPTVVTFTSSATTVCQGGSINFDATGSTIDDTLLWTFNGGNPQISNSIQETVIFNSAGTYTIYLEVIGGGCHFYAIDSMVITVDPAPSISIAVNPNDTICPAGSTILTASGAVSYVWAPGTGLSCTTCASPTASPATTTTYTVTGTGGNGCEGSTPITVYVEQPPVADFLVSEDTICANLSVIFNGAISPGATSWSWTFNGGSPSTSTISGPTITYANSGTWSFELIVGNGCGQTDTITGQIEVVVAAQAAFTQSVDTVCIGDTVFYDGSGTVGATVYDWTFNGGNPPTSNSITPVVIYNTAGTFTFQLTATGTFCSDIINGQIEVIDTVQAAFTQSADTVCENGVVNYDGTVSPGATAFSWTFNGGNPATSNSPAPAISYAAAGVYTFQLIASRPDCGIDSISGTVEVEVCIGIYEPYPGGEISSFYIRTEQMLSVTFSDKTDEVQLSVMNSLGQVVSFSELNVIGGQTHKLNVAQLPVGVYYLRIAGDRLNYVSKFVKY